MKFLAASVALAAGLVPAAVNARVGDTNTPRRFNVAVGTDEAGDRSLLDVDVAEAALNPQFIEYSPGQDTEGSTMIESPDGSSVTMVGNMWKAMPLPQSIDVSLNTYLDFTLHVEQDAEIHGICLDENLDHDDVLRCIQLGGKQYNAGNFFQASPQTAEGQTVHYKIPVGYWIGGSTVTFLGLVQDNDGAHATAGHGNSTFSDIMIYDETPTPFQIPYTNQFRTENTISLDPTQQISMSASQDRGGNFLETTSDGAIKMFGNLYKSFDLGAEAIDVGVYTTLEFDFNVTEDAEVPMLCLDTDLDENNAGTCCFVLGGTQAHGNAVLGQASDTVNEWRHNLEHTDAIGHTHYVVPVGYYCRGVKNYLHFIQDSDADLHLGLSYVSNLRVYEEDRTDLEITIDGAPAHLAMQGGYDDQDHSNNYVEVSSDGKTAHLEGNMWKALPLPYEYNVTDATVLKFHFTNTEAAEFTSICLKDDFDHSNDKRCFTVANVQSTSDTVNIEKTAVGGEKTYVIPFGHYTTAPVKFLVFINDSDGKHVDEGNGIVEFSDIEIYERTPLNVEINGEDVGLSTQIAYESTSQDRKYHMIDTSDGGNTGTLDGNMWKALPMDTPYTITADTVLSFDFCLYEQAEEIGICLDGDTDHSANDITCFLVGGEDNPNDLYHVPPRTEPGECNPYMIRVGEYLDHDQVNYLAIIQDNDADKHGGVSSFSNIKIFEAASCLGKNFALNLAECTVDNFVAGVEEQLLDGCINDGFMQLMAMFGVNHRYEVVEKVEEVCASAYAENYLAFDQVTHEEYQFDEEYMDGGTTWNYGVENDGENMLAKDAGRITIVEEISTTRGITFPDYMHNFEECDLRAVTCCFVADRQEEDPAVGTCTLDAAGDPFGANCGDANPTDNSDLCYVDFSRSPRSGHVRDGYSIYSNASEGDLYCEGFAWGNDPGYADAALNGNALFHVAMSKNLYGKGYAEQVPGASLCGCVEYMPVVTTAACTEVIVEQSVTVTYEEDIAQFVVALNLGGIEYSECSDGTNTVDLSTHYQQLVDAGKATEAEKAELDQYIVGDGNCPRAISNFLETKGLKFDTAAPTL